MTCIAINNTSLEDNTLKTEPLNGAELHRQKYGIGNFAIWLLIYLELTEFAFFFIVFLIGKTHKAIFRAH